MIKGFFIGIGLSLLQLALAYLGSDILHFTHHDYWADQGFAGAVTVWWLLIWKR